jgi:hypothetical protein
MRPPTTEWPQKRFSARGFCLASVENGLFRNLG